MCARIRERIPTADTEIHPRPADVRDPMGQIDAVDIVVSFASSLAASAAYEGLKAWLAERAQANELTLLHLNEHAAPKPLPRKRVRSKNAPR